MDPLKSSLLKDLPTASKLQLIRSLWALDTTQSEKYLSTSFAPYWTWYQSACGHALHDGGRHTLARTHQDIIDLTSRMIIGDARDVLRNALFSKPKKNSHHNMADMVDSAIDLAASLLLMIDFTAPQHGHSGSRRLQWDQGSLRDCVENYFRPVKHLGHDGVKLPRVFNAQALHQVAGVRIVPTSNLLDHLRLTEDDTKIYIFHHTAFLKFQPKGSLIPSDVIDETRRTLALLFPSSDPALRRWCRRLPDFSSMDPEILSCGHLKTDDRQIENFVHWHDRPVVLKQVFDEATSRTLSQWWHDRRNGVQWWTFWVAIVVLALTLLFGFIQCITGIMQVYAAFNPGDSV